MRLIFPTNKAHGIVIGMEQNLKQPYRFRDARQERIYRRLRLIGEGPAEFYRDACRLMEDSGALASTSHLVGHLMREVESSVRTVLHPGVSGHVNSIVAVLKGLEIDESSPIAQLWLTLPGDEGLDKKAHRNALFQPRAVDREFMEYWDRLQSILDFVLERFEERYLEYHGVLDEHAAIEAPTKADVETIKQRAPNNLVSYRYFFDKLSSSKWLKPLYEEGFFSYPPAPVIEGEFVRFPPWPQSQYLARMARQDPDTVTDIIFNIPKTQNINVLTDLAEATCEMPAKYSTKLVEKVNSWINSPYFGSMLLPEVLGTPQSGQETAIRIGSR